MENKKLETEIQNMKKSSKYQYNKYIQDYEEMQNKIKKLEKLIFKTEVKIENE